MVIIMHMKHISAPRHKTEASQGWPLLMIDAGNLAIRLATQLTFRGFNVTLEKDPERALVKAQQMRASHIILEAQLGAQNGLLLIPPLKEMLPHSKLVVHSYHAPFSAVTWAVRAGADDYAQKPSDPDIMTSLLTGDKGKLPERLQCPFEVRRQYIGEIVQRYQHNITHSANTLKLTRRSIQRRLASDRDCEVTPFLWAAE